MAFAFSFSGDDIEDDPSTSTSTPTPPANPPSASASASAFPIQGKTQLPPTFHPLPDLLARLPSKIAYDILHVPLDPTDQQSDAAVVHLPRRELWDVRVQLMAEDDDTGHDQAESGEVAEGLGKSDVKTGVYEGGFKSWESSVDLVKVLLSGKMGSLALGPEQGARVIELGCGTALPSLALFEQALAHPPSVRGPLTLVLADYNPSVLRLVTLPNLILTWALHFRNRNPASASESASCIPALNDAFSMEGELELLPSVIDAFTGYLVEQQITPLFFSGSWSPEFAALVQANISQTHAHHGSLLVLGAETIYSPFALHAFTDSVFRLLKHKQDRGNVASGCLVAAKRLYFGVGGSLDDFADLARSMGAVVTALREETEGVRRGVLQVVLPSAP